MNCCVFILINILPSIQDRITNIYSFFELFGNCVIKGHAIESSRKSPCLHPVFGPPFIPHPLFEWGRQSKKLLLNLGMKCWNSTFNHVESFKNNYSSPTCRSSENICTSSGGPHGKGKRGSKQDDITHEGGGGAF